MHKLARQIRFSINPFLDDGQAGYNSFSSRPAGDGLAIYLALRVELAAGVNPDTGFVVNITEIDGAVRELVVPVFDEAVKRHYRNKLHISFEKLRQLLGISKKILSEFFSETTISDICLELNPNRKLGIKNDRQDSKMTYFGEKFDFAAMHKLWNDKFSDKQNYKVFGKCANPAGHGHNYTAEVIVELPEDGSQFNVAEYQKIVEQNFIDIVDHKNLNVDVDYFKTKNSTVENIAAFAWKQLKNKFKDVKLSRITIWETDRTSCSVSGDEA